MGGRGYGRVVREDRLLTFQTASSSRRHQQSAFSTVPSNPLVILPVQYTHHSRSTNSRPTPTLAFPSRLAVGRTPAARDDPLALQLRLARPTLGRIDTKRQQLARTPAPLDDRQRTRMDQTAAIAGRGWLACGQLADGRRPAPSGCPARQSHPVALSVGRSSVFLPATQATCKQLTALSLLLSF